MLGCAFMTCSHVIAVAAPKQDTMPLRMCHPAWHALHNPRKSAPLGHSEPHERQGSPAIACFWHLQSTPIMTGVHATS